MSLINEIAGRVAKELIDHSRAEKAEQEVIERAFVLTIKLFYTASIISSTFLVNLASRSTKIRQPRNGIGVSLPTKDKVADGILIFLCKPDEAEALVGDLLEQYAKIDLRQHRNVANLWFAWELSILTLLMAKKRFAGLILPRKLVDYFSKTID